MAATTSAQYGSYNVKKVEHFWQRFVKHAPEPLYALAGIVVVLMAEIENTHRQRKGS